MKSISRLSMIVLLGAMMASCVSTKELSKVQDNLTNAERQLTDAKNQLNLCNNNLAAIQSATSVKDDQIADLRDQLADARNLRDRQLSTVDDLTKVSQSANENIAETLQQLEGKDQYINLLQAAKTRSDSVNLALAVNLKGVLQDGIADSDIEVKVDKTVVFVNLSDKVLYSSGSATLSPRANEVLGKIAQIIQSRPELEVMVEGYTDNMPINSQCMIDNWDLSVKRSTAVVRALQMNHGIDPNRLIAAGRGEYNALASNDSYEGRATNRRTRIIILPKLNEFYDLLNPDKVPE